MPAGKSPLSAEKLAAPIFRELKPPRSPLPFTATLPTDAEIAQLILRWEKQDATFAKQFDTGIPPAAAMGGMAVRLCLAGQNDAALELLCAAAVVETDNLAVLNNLAVVLDRLHRTADSAACVERSLEMNPTQTDSWIFLATLKQKQNDLPGAQLAYETAVKQQPIAPLAWQGLGLILQRRQRPDEAITCLLKCIEQQHVTAPVLAVLGQLFYTTGQFDKSQHAYAAALDCEPSNIVFRQMRDEMRFVTAIIQGQDINAVLASQPGSTDTNDELLHKTFALLGAYGHASLAVTVAEKRAELFPDSATAAYLLQAIHGNGDVPRSPDAYLIESFNRHAGRFDDHLVNTLRYRIPEKLAAVVRNLIREGPPVDLLDLGCGTGLCGMQVRSFCSTLTGIDLADQMIERARARGIYDRLACEEITAFLNTSPEKFDVIIAADVLIYFGDLTALAAGVAAALRLGGLVAFSIERADTAHPLLTSGRFAHDPAYIRQTFSRDFTECHFEEAGIRLEGIRMVPGNLFAFRRNGTD